MLGYLYRLFVSQQQDTTDKVIYKEEKCIPYSSGGWEVEDLGTAIWFGVGLLTVCFLTWQKGEGWVKLMLCEASFKRALIPKWGSRPLGLNISERLHLLILLYWQHLNFGEAPFKPFHMPSVVLYHPLVAIQFITMALTAPPYLVPLGSMASSRSILLSTLNKPACPPHRLLHGIARSNNNPLLQLNSFQLHLGFSTSELLIF